MRAMQEPSVRGHGPLLRYGFAGMARSYGAGAPWLGPRAGAVPLTRVTR
jgi:hypothetical protein